MIIIGVAIKLDVLSKQFESRTWRRFSKIRTGIAVKIATYGLIIANFQL